MSHELSTDIVDCQFNPVTPDMQVVTLQAITATPPSTNPNGILVQSFFGEGLECVSHLEAPDCELDTEDSQNLILGQSEDGSIQWLKGDWFLTQMSLPAASAIDVDNDNIDVYYFNGVSPAAWTIGEPLSVCSRNHVYVKNRSGTTLTLTGAGVLVNGAAAEVIGAGDARHYTYVPALNDWMSI